MRILFFIGTNESIVGGMEKQAALLANLLAEYSDIDVHIIAADHFSSLFSKEIVFHGVSLNKSRRNILSLWQILRICKRINPDIIHVHGQKASDMITTIHTFLTKPTYLVATIHGIKKRYKRLGYFDQLIAVSKLIHKRLEPLNSTIIENVTSTLTPKEISKPALLSSLNLTPDLPLIAAVGRVEPVKGFDRLIEACRHLPVNLIIIGDGSVRNELESKAPSNVFFYGYQDDPCSLLAHADIHVISSEREGFGLTLLESLLVRTPVISPRNVGSLAHLNLPESALVNTPSVEELKQAITFAISDLNSFNSAFNQCYEQATQLNDPNKYTQRHITLYKTLLEKQKLIPG